VITHIAVIAVPRAQPDVEARIALDHVGVNRVDLIELSVRRGEQRVQQRQPQVLLRVGVDRARHSSPHAKQKARPARVTQAVKYLPDALPLSYAACLARVGRSRTFSLRVPGVCMLGPLGAGRAFYFNRVDAAVRTSHMSDIYVLCR
jgi:hypothetical protein